MFVGFVCGVCEIHGYFLSVFRGWVWTANASFMFARFFLVYVHFMVDFCHSLLVLFGQQMLLFVALFVTSISLGV